MNAKHRIRAVTLDVGGTLIEPWPSVGHVYAKVADRFGVACEAELVNRNFAAAWKARPSLNYTKPEWFELVRQSFPAGSEVTEELFEAIYLEFTKTSAWRVFEDVPAAIDLILSRGLKLGLISNWDERLRPLMKQFALAPRFDAFIVSTEVGFHKPAPEIFRAAVDALGVPGEGILDVGESEREGAAGARNAGMLGIKIERRSQPENQLLRALESVFADLV